MKSLFTRIDSSSHTAVSSAQVIYSFMTFFKKTCLLFHFMIANVFFLIDRLEPSFTDCVFRFRFRFRIPCFSAVDFRRLSDAERGGGGGDFKRWKICFWTCKVEFFFSSLGIYFFGAESVGIYFFIKNILGKIFFCFCPTLPHHFSKGPRLIKIY